MIICSKATSTISNIIKSHTCKPHAGEDHACQNLNPVFCHNNRSKLLLDHSSMEIFLFLWGNSLIPPSHTLVKNRLLVPCYPLHELRPFFIGIYRWKLDWLPVAQAVGNSKGPDEIWSDTFMKFTQEHLTIELTLWPSFIELTLWPSFIEHIPFRLRHRWQRKTTILSASPQCTFLETLLGKA